MNTVWISKLNSKKTKNKQHKENALFPNHAFFKVMLQTLKRTTTPRGRWTVCTNWNASRTERNVLGTKRNASRTERFAFLGTERFVRFGIVFNFPRYSDFLARRTGLLFIFATLNENKFHLIRSTCSFVIFFYLKKEYSRWKLLILSIVFT